MPPDDSDAYRPPPFQPHPVYRGGHLQTILSIGKYDSPLPDPIQHIVPVSDGDAIVLHENRPPDWQPDDGAMLLIHGLSGSHAAPYMIRLAHRFYDTGIAAFRMDMRGVGAALELSRNVLHSGRSDDVMAALATIGQLTGSGPLRAMGVSLGGHQLLRGLSRIGADIDAMPDWFHRLERVAVVAPPFNLPQCARNMLRISRRIYNHYFIRNLLAQVPPLVRQREEYLALQQDRRRIKTLVELDERFTAPISGFEGAWDYYEKCSVHEIASENPIDTLVLVSADDPIVPSSNFTDPSVQWPVSTTLHVTSTGGHAGFIDRDRNSWMDLAIMQWFA